jgi:hypothetical protein
MSIAFQSLTSSACRFAANSLMSTIAKFGTSPASFVQLLGVGDSSNFGSIAPTWQVPAAYQDKCYFSDTMHPAADIAAQTAAALAMLAKLFRTYGTTSDKASGGLADRMAATATAAFVAAKDAYERFGRLSTCALSSANTNCVGSCVAGANGVRSMLSMSCGRSAAYVTGDPAAACIQGATDCTQSTCK